MTTYSRQETWLPWRQNKDVCIRGKSRRPAAEGTHAVRLTVMEDWGGLKREECLLFLIDSAFPRNLSSHSRTEPHGGGGGVWRGRWGGPV